MKKVFSLLCLLALSACEAGERTATSEFRPDANAGTFEFKATADAGYPADSPSAEVRRIRFLEQYLTDNGVCPSGYVITGRQEVLVQAGLLGNIVDIFYTGRCNS